MLKEEIYLRIVNTSFGFVIEGIHEITDDDISISKDEYEYFLLMQSEGKQFRVKNDTGISIFDVIEEYIPGINTNIPKTELEILKENQILMQKALDELLLGGM